MRANGVDHTLTAFASLAKEFTGNILADPIFVAYDEANWGTPAAHDLHPRDGSPAIKAGAASGVPLDIQGLQQTVPPTIGAYATSDGATPVPAPILPPEPTPTPEPVPGSEPASLPSVHVKSRIVTSTQVAVYSKPNTHAGKIICKQPAETLGTVTSGPTTQQGYEWWQIDFDNGCDGYVMMLGIAPAPITGR
jgi:hypothetical protein